MANVHFTVTRDMPLAAADVFAELINWQGHADWVPLTRVKMLSGDGGPGRSGQCSPASFSYP